MSLLDQIRDYSEGEEPVEASDAALIDGALEKAGQAPPPGLHPGVVAGGVAVVAVVAVALLWPSGEDPDRKTSRPEPAEHAASTTPVEAAPTPQEEPPKAPTPPVEVPPADVEGEPTPITAEVAPTPDTGRTPAKRATLNDLLERAQAKRAAGKHSEAAQIYRRAVRAYPKVPAARRALVTLAELELTQLGRPGAALKTFERYLKQGKDPVLVQEAGYGRLRALRKIGRRGAEAAAIEEFLAAHPKSPYRKALQERQKELVTPSPPAGLNPSDD